MSEAPSSQTPSRYRLEEVKASEGAAFEEAYGALDREFGSRGELERRDVIRGWIDRDRAAKFFENEDGLRLRYHLVAARDIDNKLVGVRDCHVVIDPIRNVTVVYLAHVLVLPDHRRTGLGKVLREIGVMLAKRDIQACGEDLSAMSLLMAAEMEPVVADDEASIVRLIAYGRAGFAAIPPSNLPYSQPDFRDPKLIGDTPRPLPLLAVVRQVSQDPARTRSLTVAQCEAFVTHLYAVFATHCDKTHMKKPREHALSTLHESQMKTIPLLPLPKSTTDQDAIAPLMRDHVLRTHWR